MTDPVEAALGTQRCPSCSTLLRGDARFCGNCGAKVTRESIPDSSSIMGSVVAGAYRVERVLGTGSMGVVYQAEQLALGRKIALKVISESQDDETTRARFRREARAASQLNHPNVVQVFDFGQLSGGQPYLAMELLQGKTLESLIEKEYPIPLDRAAAIMLDVLSALQAAHDMGILHRDLKPANVYVCALPDDREVSKVLDFGIATAMDATLTGSKTWAPLTEAGFVCGTPAFMSPEQVQGFALDQRSDLFSAGGLLYQVLTRQRPFPGKSPVEVGANIVLKALMPASRVRPERGFPPEIDAFLAKAMAKRQDDRFRSARDMADALRAIVEPLTEVADQGVAGGADAEVLGDSQENVSTTVEQARLSAEALAQRAAAEKAGADQAAAEKAVAERASVVAAKVAAAAPSVKASTPLSGVERARPEPATVLLPTISADAARYSGMMPAEGGRASGPVGRAVVPPTASSSRLVSSSGALKPPNLPTPQPAVHVVPAGARGEAAPAGRSMGSGEGQVETMVRPESSLWSSAPATPPQTLPKPSTMAPPLATSVAQEAWGARGPTPTGPLFAPDSVPPGSAPVFGAPGSMMGGPAMQPAPPKGRGRVRVYLLALVVVSLVVVYLILRG